MEVQGVVCLCNDECIRTGAVSCDLSETKPLCGGRCTNQPKTRELACGAGIDTVKLEPFTLAVKDVAAAAVALPSSPIAFERAGGQP
jgi:hypothetical protein